MAWRVAKMLAPAPMPEPMIAPMRPLIRLLMGSRIHLDGRQRVTVQADPECSTGARNKACGLPRMMPRFTPNIPTAERESRQVGAIGTVPHANGPFRIAQVCHPPSRFWFCLNSHSIDYERHVHCPLGELRPIGNARRARETAKHDAI